MSKTKVLLFIGLLLLYLPQVAQNLPEEVRITPDGRMIITGDTRPQGFYDDTIIRRIDLVFSQANYWQLLTQNYATRTNIMAKMLVDSVEYDSVGVHFKGNTSYNMAQGQKKSFGIDIDFYRPWQEVMGYETLNLNNAFEDASFLREFLYSHLIRKHTTGLRSSFARLYLNGQDWGLYPNIQQLNQDYLKEWFVTNNGTLWRADKPAGTGGGGPGPGGGWGDGTAAFNNLGTDTTTYKQYYTLKKAHKAYPWDDLVLDCRALNTIPATNMGDSIQHYFDLDRTLWFLACEILFTDDDSYVYKGKMDYYHYWEPETGRMIPLEFDGNSAISLQAATQWSPFYNVSKVNYPLLNKLLNVPEIRQRYLAHVRTIAKTSLDPNIVNPQIDMWKGFIDAQVQSDPKKLYSYSAFGTEVTELKNFFTTRYNYIMGNTEVAEIAPIITNPEYAVNGQAWTYPATNEPVNVTCEVSSSNGILSTDLYYSTDFTGSFEKIQMFDDGTHNDGAAGDGVFGATIPGMPSATNVRFYIAATANNTAKSVSYMPEGAEHDVYFYHVNPALSPNQSVAINEIMASNSSSVQDNMGEYDDWIELYNKSGVSIDLTGYTLSDNNYNITKWELPVGTILPPNDYLIIWADEDSSQGVFHANFKLSAGEGEYLLLLDPSGLIVDSMSFGAIPSDMGYARVPNGIGSFVIQQHTFDANNQATDIDLAMNPVSLKFYPNPARNQVTIAQDKAWEGAIDIQVFNTLGQPVISMTLQENQTIDLTNWSAGVYYFRYGNKSEKLIVVK